LGYFITLLTLLFP